MAVELQFRTSVLGSLIARVMRRRLREVCLPPAVGVFGPGTVYVDHADVLGSEPLVRPGARAGTAEVRMRVALYPVPREDLLARPGEVPAGALGAGRVDVPVVVELAVDGTTLRADPCPCEGWLPGGAGLVDALAGVVAFDLRPTFDALGLPRPGAGVVEAGAGPDAVVAVRFDAAGPGARHLAPGHEWGVFLDARTVEAMAAGDVTERVGGSLTSTTVSATWAPRGATAHVDVRVTGRAAAPGVPAGAEVDTVFGCDVTLARLPLPALRTAVTWDVEARAAAPASGGPEAGEHVPADVADRIGDSFIDAFVLGPRTRAVDRPLPRRRIAGGTLHYASAVADPAGLTIGGPVGLPAEPGDETVRAVVLPFGEPVRLDRCSVLARGATAVPERVTGADEVYAHAGVRLEQAGALAAVEVLRPAGAVEPYLTRHREDEDTHEVRLRVPASVALGEPVRLLVRTARGVRVVDLGRPGPVTVRPDGGVTGALVVTLNDCVVLPHGDGEGYGLRWGGPGGAPEALWERLHGAVTPPSSRRTRPPWPAYLSSSVSLGVQLVTLTGLRPGELLQLRTRDHAADVTAGPDGRATVPVLLPADGTVPRATLVRVNRMPIEGDVRVRSVVIEHHLSVPGGRGHRLEVTGDAVRLVVDLGDEPPAVHEFGPGRPLRAPHPGPESGPAAPAPARTVRRGAVREAMEAVARAAVRAHAVRERVHVDAAVSGVEQVVAVPGFETEPVAVALMDDGTALLLDLDEEGTGVARVAGTYEGPIGALTAQGGWATVPDGDRVDVYRVIHGPSRRVRAARRTGGEGTAPPAQGS